jgi:hypothetical protein
MEFTSEEIVNASLDVCCQLEEHGNLDVAAECYGFDKDVLDVLARFVTNHILGSSEEDDSLSHWMRQELEDIWGLVVLIGVCLRFGIEPRYEKFDSQMLCEAVDQIHNELEFGAADRDADHIVAAEQLRRDFLISLHKQYWRLILNLKDVMGTENAETVFVKIFDHALVFSMFI